MPRKQSVCLRAYDEYVQLSSLLKSYINMSPNLTPIPKIGGKKSDNNNQKESISKLLKWCGSSKQILQLTPIQLFLFTILPMGDVERIFKIATRTGSLYR